ncbi:MAG: HAD-IA family hydrolase [Candidatus Aminicenantes bacterium]|nr:HAD-IA family hydrolase [Candidatus Aminicenantes bacterium]
MVLPGKGLEVAYPFDIIESRVLGLIIKKIKGIELLSVDLFDTLITRSVAFPADIFYALEKKIKNFAEARIKSEYQLREEKGFKQEVTHDEIYSRLRAELGLSETQSNRVREMEMALEEQCILPIEPVVNALKEIKKTLKIKVILISDTYLPEAFIAKILKKHRLSGLFDRLYISSTHGVQKSTGSMFRFVKKEENIPVKKWLHIGDNEESDYKIPRKMGIRARWFQEAHLARCEKTFAPHPGSGSSHSAFTALLRQARLDCPYKKANEKMIWNTTIDVSAPLMIAYVQWCLNKARSLGLSRVYFLARDGQVLFKIAGILNRSSPSPLDIRYLYVSRQSLLFPAMQGIDKESLEWILLPTSLVTPRIILKRVNIEPGEIAPLLEKYGFQNADKKMTKDELRSFESVLKDRDIHSLLEERIKVYRENAWGYLQQEELTKDGSFVLVDIGWNGTLQRSISRLLEMKKKNFPVNGLYFGLRRALKHKDSDKSDTFFFSPGQPQGLERETHIIPMIELFTAADHGGVVKYEFKDNRYKPVLASSENTHGIRWGIRIQQQAMTYLAERIESNSLDDLLPGIYQNLRQFVRTPSLREAEVYGSYLDAEDQNESYYFPLARKYNCLELFRHYKYGYLHHHNEWKEGARRLSHGRMFDFFLTKK